MSIMKQLGQNNKTGNQTSTGLTPSGRNIFIGLGVAAAVLMGAQYMRNQKPFTDMPAPPAITAPVRDEDRKYSPMVNAGWDKMLKTTPEEARAETVKEWTADNCKLLKEALCTYKHPHTAKNAEIAGVIDHANQLGLFNDPQIFKYMSDYLDTDSKLIVAKASGQATVMDALKLAITQADILASTRR